ncbi:hypothetical protein SuNHUV7_40750 (plasmid) [Pseudoseohaeicola sp. NH-UV-7]|uniref:hypothetical protein n=1 Tax=unclassified Sulfitobacter TaxID=196795 RepID=UPI000E0ACE17|nr:hypothetical protein [Sulfitobacter sp. JL08]AXI55076.1 hypothetical protein C1J05_11770 [Sulfitobacter sp. JL08]
MSPELQIYSVPIAAMIVGAFAFMLAPRILGLKKDSEGASLQVMTLRVVLVIFLVLQLSDIVLHNIVGIYYNRMLLNMSLTVFAITICFVFFNVSGRMLDAKFGATRQIDGKMVAVPSYHSRMASVVLLGAMLIILIYVLIEIWGLNSLLEKTGFIGIIAAFFVLTSAIWLPDLFHGVVLLGSSMAEEGDTVILRDRDRLCIINRLTPFYTLLLDVDKNHRILVRNCDLMKWGIENYTKRASVDGLRRTLEFKLGYPSPTGARDPVTNLFEKIEKSVDACCARAFEDDHIMVNKKLSFEWAAVDAGDYALSFRLYYYLSPLPETKLTSKIRKHMRATDNAIVRIMFEEAFARSLNLATPALVHLDTSQKTAQPAPPHAP